MPNGSGRVPAIDCTREAWLFLRDNWRLFLPAAAVTSVIAQIGMVLALASGPEAGNGSLFATQAGAVISSLPSVIASLMFAAVVLRKFIRNEFVSGLGLAFGADEIRLFGIWAAFMCMIIPFGTLVMLVLVFTVFSRLDLSQDELSALMENPEALNQALINALGPGGTAMFLLFCTALIALLLYVAVRLTMVNAATIGERRIVMFQTWPWSRGNVLPMLGAIMLTAIPAYLLTTILSEILLGVLGPIANPGNAGMLSIIHGIVVGFVASLLSVPSVALGAIFYRGLRPVDFLAK